MSGGPENQEPPGWLLGLSYRWDLFPAIAFIRVHLCPSVVELLFQFLFRRVVHGEQQTHPDSESGSLELASRSASTNFIPA